MVQMPVDGSKLPCDGVAPTTSSPDGMASITLTPVASLGPAFETATTNVTTSP